MSVRICIPYFSGSGHTARLAQAIGDGAEHAALIDVTNGNTEDLAMLAQADAIIFGAPTYMGSTAARYDQFLEHAAADWPELVWRDKIAAGFTIGTHGSGDKLIALQRLSIFAAQMGMIWVGQTAIGAPAKPENAGTNRDGAWLGLMATSSRDKSQMIDPDDLTTARLFGQRIAQVTTRWKRGAA